MITVLKKGAKLKAMNKISKEISKIHPKKGLDAGKYCGSVKFKEDELVLQDPLRNE